MALHLAATAAPVSKSVRRSVTADAVSLPGDRDKIIAAFLGSLLEERIGRDRLGRYRRGRRANRCSDCAGESPFDAVPLLRRRSQIRRTRAGAGRGPGRHGGVAAARAPVRRARCAGSKLMRRTARRCARRRARRANSPLDAGAQNGPRCARRTDARRRRHQVSGPRAPTRVEGLAALSPAVLCAWGWMMMRYLVGADSWRCSTARSDAASGLVGLVEEIGQVPSRWCRWRSCWRSSRRRGNDGEEADAPAAARIAAKSTWAQPEGMSSLARSDPDQGAAAAEDHCQRRGFLSSSGIPTHPTIAESSETLIASISSAAGI